MRTAWAVILGIVAAGIAVWWFGREDATGAGADRNAVAGSGSKQGEAARSVLYRWRDDAGTVQITDSPPRGRAHETVDIATLERRNVFDPNTSTPPPE